MYQYGQSGHGTGGKPGQGDWSTQGAGIGPGTTRSAIHPGNDTPCSIFHDRGIAAGSSRHALFRSVFGKDAGLLIEQWDLEDIRADLARCGLAGSPTKVYKVQSIVLTKEGYTELPPNEEGARQLIHELIVDHTLG